MELAAQRLIIALDDITEEKRHRLIAETLPFATTYKIGLSAFVAHGHKIIEEVTAQGAQIFLDLKFHDIPMQTRKAVERALTFSPRFLTVHAQGGRAMLREVAEVAKGTSTKILAVTMLTSLGEQDMQTLGLKASVLENVVRLADLVLSSGLDGLVASPQELAILRRYFGSSAFLVCPGIRSVDDAAHDQMRTLSAYEAIRQGADALVVGRPITKAENSLLRASAIHEEMRRAMNENQARVLAL